jgi:hypothetical protein
MKLVNFAGTDDLIGKIVNVKIDKALTWILRGKAMPEKGNDHECAPVKEMSIECPPVKGSSLNCPPVKGGRGVSNIPTGGLPGTSSLCWSPLHGR